MVNNGRELISIIVPIYNTEKYLDRCLNSIIKQDYLNLEAILVNDGSTDNSESIVKNYMERYDHIRYIKQENKGIGAARNAGVQIAKGNFISFVDSDDVIMPQYCSYLLSIIGDADIAVAGREKYIEDIYEKSKTPSKIITVSGVEAFKYQLLGIYNARPAWGKLYTREIVEKNSFQESCIFEEVRYSAETFLKANKVVFADKDLYSYRARPNSIMTSNEEQRVKEFPIALEYVYEMLIKKGFYHECELEFKIWLISAIVQNTKLYCRKDIDDEIFKKYTDILVDLYDKTNGIVPLQRERK